MIVAVKQAIQNVQDKSQIVGIGISGQQHGMVVLGADKKVSKCLL